MQNRVEFKKKLDYLKKQIIDKDASNSLVQHFTLKYATIYTNENYYQLKKKDKHLVDCKRSENDFNYSLTASELLLHCL